MNTFRIWFRKNKSNLYKLLLFTLATISIVYMFPKKGKFKYDYGKGKPWQYENLYAPFDFAILKSNEDLEVEKQQIKDKSISFFEYDEAISAKVFKEAEDKFKKVFSNQVSSRDQAKLYKVVMATLKVIYNKGIYNKSYPYAKNKLIYLKKGTEVTENAYGNINDKEAVAAIIKEKIKSQDSLQHSKLTYLLFDIIKPNVSFNESLTNKALIQELSKVLTIRGSVKKDTRIIAKGEEVDLNTFQILKSLQNEFEAKIWSENNQNWIILGYTALIAMSILMLFLFIQQYRPKVFKNNKKVTFIVFNIILMVFLTTLVIKYNTAYVYIVPVAILPLVVKAFFDSRLALFIHVITVLILSLIVPNGDQYVFLQIMAGIVSILTSSELYKRANLFLSVGQITLVYIISYLSFHIIQEGGISAIEELQPLLLFVLCGFATLIVHPLIYGFEKVFGLVSDVSLLELSDTNSTLLKKLSNEAPGTFYHSLNVANIAEACANEIGANAMLTRVGALYHDIGKMKKSAFFTENQTSGINRHDALSPEESAKIIINHVSNGVEIARKYKLPKRVVDFIRTHHGTSTVYYFYKKAQETNPEVAQSLFQYPGPIPFTKEMAILMMSDSVEAASKSLKQPTADLINDFIEKIIDKQMGEGQFLDADITFKEIQTIKKVMKRKLANIYHLRVEYPK